MTKQIYKKQLQIAIDDDNLELAKQLWQKLDTMTENHKPKQRPNLFHDDGTECVKDKAIDKLLAIRPPTPRRQETNKIIVTCEKCKDSVEIYPSQKRTNMRFVCNNCCVGDKKSHGTD